ncbi:uncharacterized protein LOC127103328 [Lathyrus oleraceus]|uniref:uncharacterized protein LOC127103328 n=1 Tax=Pisum sativum TaxID=3888 RepID=UPI0021D36E45|nr:uncharacterized protein LOC127103328 [Pisum sativum]
MDEEDEEIFDIFIKVAVNVPLLNVIKQIPKYAKSLKNLCTHKRRLKGSERVNMGRNVSDFIQPKTPEKSITEQNVSAFTQAMPQKCKDPRTFAIPCTIGDNFFILDMEGEAESSRASIILVEALDIPTSPTKLSIGQPPSVELKPLPDNLKCPFLERNEKLTVLKKHKKVIGWTLADLPSISHSTCMHRILLEDGAKVVRHPQRIHNPLILDVVKNEITKLLQEGYFHIHIAPEHHEKTTFTWPFMFMDDFTIYGSSFDACLKSLDMILERCIETDLVFNYEKFHFMVELGIVLWHIISIEGILVDHSKIDVISTLPYPSCIREIHYFLGYAGFYMRFIKDLSKIALPLSNLLKNDITFNFDDKCKKAFDFLKKALTSTPIIQPPDWTLPFEIICDASNYGVGAVLA